MAKEKNDWLATLTIATTVKEAEAAAEHVKDDGSILEKLSVIAGRAIKAVARGGFIITEEWAERIKTAIGTADGSVIAEHVEKAVGRRGDCHVVEWVVDPTQVTFYRMQAENSGKSLDHHLKSMMDFAYEQGWLGSTAPEAFKLLLAPEEYAELQSLFKKDIVTGHDVVSMVRKVMTTEEDSLVLDSLMEEAK